MFLVSSLFFCLVPCGRLSWLLVSFWAHVNIVHHIISYHIISYTSSVGEKQYKFEEILPIYKQVSADAESGTFADFMEAFKTFDREGQGFIHAAELRHVLTSLGPPLAPLSCTVADPGGEGVRWVRGRTPSHLSSPCRTSACNAKSSKYCSAFRQSTSL